MELLCKFGNLVNKADGTVKDFNSVNCNN